MKVLLLFFGNRKTLEKKTDNETDNETGRGNTFTKKIGKTIYKITVHFSKTSKETAQDKAKRMIMRDIESGNTLDGIS